jgi:NH3-dependent NAD+ synthetase
VIGTGDLSELALGWCTYGVGDQMAHYGVNAGLPKTLIQHLIRWCIASGQFAPSVRTVLETVLNTEISPELVPATEGESQKTEEIIGPYALHDFTLYHVLRHGFAPYAHRLSGRARVGQRTNRRMAPPVLTPMPARPTRCLSSATGWTFSPPAAFFSPPASSNARPCPMAQK